MHSLLREVSTLAFRLLLEIMVGDVYPNINVAAPHLVSLRGPSVSFVCQTSLTSVKWSSLRGEKLQKSLIRFLRKDAFSKFVPSPTNHRGNIEEGLHGCTTAFLPLHKSVNSCIKICITSQ